MISFVMKGQVYNILIDIKTIYVVYKSHGKYESQTYPKKIFKNKIDAKKFIENYPSCPWHYLRIKEMKLY